MLCCALLRCVFFFVFDVLRLVVIRCGVSCFIVALSCVVSRCDLLYCVRCVALSRVVLSCVLLLRGALCVVFRCVVMPYVVFCFLLRCLVLCRVVL